MRFVIWTLFMPLAGHVGQFRQPGFDTSPALTPRSVGTPEKWYRPVGLPGDKPYCRASTRNQWESMGSKYAGRSDSCPANGPPCTGVLENFPFKNRGRQISVPDGRRWQNTTPTDAFLDSNPESPNQGEEKRRYSDTTTPHDVWQTCGGVCEGAVTGYIPATAVS